MQEKRQKSVEEKHTTEKSVIYILDLHARGWEIHI